MMKIWIDAGHGMSNREVGRYDPGACANNRTEAEIALEWALTGKWVLEQAGIETYLTRDDDRDSSFVGSRAANAMQARCTHGISLHMNAGVPQANGTETFYRDSRDVGLAGTVQAVALSVLKTRDRGLKTEGQSQHSRLAVMDFTPPNCLLEIGFITNLGDLKRATDRASRIAFWQGIAAAVMG